MAKQPNWKRHQVASDTIGVTKEVAKSDSGSTVELTSFTGDVHPEAEPIKTYEREVLEACKMSELREIGALFGVKDNKKSELIDKIMEAGGK